MSEGKGSRPTSLKLTEHFTVKEMACPHCGVCLMRDTFMKHLEEFRVARGIPVRVTSGYRCPDHNRSVGGARDSQHVKGNAADISTAGLSKEQIEELRVLALKHFNNAVVGPGFIHVDDGPKREWSY